MKSPLAYVSMESKVSDVMKPYPFEKDGGDKVYILTPIQVKTITGRLEGLYPGRFARITRTSMEAYEILGVRFKGKAVEILFKEDVRS